MEMDTSTRDLLVHHADMHHRKDLSLEGAKLLLELCSAIIEPSLFCTHATVIDMRCAAGQKLRRRTFPLAVAIVVVTRERAKHVDEEVAQTQLPKQWGVTKATHCLQQLDAPQDVTVGDVWTLETYISQVLPHISWNRDEGFPRHGRDRQVH